MREKYFQCNFYRVQDDSEKKHYKRKFSEIRIRVKFSLSLVQSGRSVIQKSNNNQRTEIITTPPTPEGSSVTLPVLVNSFHSSGVNTFSGPEHHDVDDSVSGFEENFKKWCIVNKISLSAVSELLKILKVHTCFSSLPNDARTLLKTPRKAKIFNVDPGQYCHFGIKDQLSQLIESHRVSIGNKITLQFNIDGIPISKSSGKQFWPILSYAVELDKIFEVGIYCGNEKPKDSLDFLNYFVQELSELCDNGLQIKNNNFDIVIDSFICDAPARAFILNIKGHTGYFGCSKCTQEGKYIKNRVTFPKIDCPKRTNDGFRLKVDEDHHHGLSGLEKLNIDLVKQVPYEFMHLFCLGVTRKFLLLWTSGSVKKFRLSCYEKLQFTRALITLKPFIPLEFARKPRPVAEFKRWKAAELRQFLLYTGPLVLKKLLPLRYYNHFICLHLAITILCSEKFHKKYNTYASLLLQSFVKEFLKLYGDEQVSHNIHGLIHLAEDSTHFGTLDKFSAFKFENHLGFLSSLLRGKNRPLEQVYNRISERNAGLIKDLKSEFVKPMLSKSKKTIQFQHFKLSCNEGNSTCELQMGAIIKIQGFTEINGSIICKGRVYQTTKVPLYDIPEDSSRVGIRVASLSQEHISVPVELISSKHLALPYKKSEVIFPLLHL
ncbi:uncharacterized protein LOC110856045 isoform X2 [Folsomia candida]|uniref:uncharacterized protein LOC110856045 isoform X2 n=1 Tax=Folsomia candida TaxID=158441 RepID=UPI001604BBFB|nr:uncharacterized protein LOC110856045 isoform X2 [Folsomia candida]